MNILGLFGNKSSRSKREENQRPTSTKNKVVTEKVIEKRKIPASRLRVGMTVIELDRPWTDVPVMFQELKISSQNEVNLLQKYCQHVYIDAESYRTYYKTIVDLIIARLSIQSLICAPTKPVRIFVRNLKKLKLLLIAHILISIN